MRLQLKRKANGFHLSRNLSAEIKALDDAGTSYQGERIFRTAYRKIMNRDNLHVIISLNEVS